MPVDDDGIDRDAYRTLGEQVRARRRQLRLTQEEIRERGGPSTATMRLIEAGKTTDFRRSTVDQLEAVLYWQSGSVDAILHGGQAADRVGEEGANRYGTVGSETETPGVLLKLSPEAFEGLDPLDRQRAEAEATAAWLRVAQEARRRAEEGRPK